jgi:hypothetical protein
LLKVTIYHNNECRFMPYRDGQELVAVTYHWLPSRAGRDPETLADWAFHTFNADLDVLERGRDTVEGETTFLAACVYRLMGYRSLSTGDVVEIQNGPERQWLACQPVGWRHLASPSNLSGQPLTAAKVYRHLAGQRHKH